MRTLKFTFKGATGSWGLVDHDFGETREIILKLPPEPSSHNFNGRAFKAFDVIEVGMIHHLEERIHRLRNALVIVNPADGFIDLALDMNLDLKTVTVHLTAFVVLRKAGKCVGGFEAEVFDESGAHDRLVLR